MLGRGGAAAVRDSLSHRLNRYERWATKTKARSGVEGFVSVIIQALLNLLKMGEQEEEKVGAPHAKQQARLCQDFKKNPLEYK